MAPRVASEEETQARTELDFCLPWTGCQAAFDFRTVRFPGVKTHLTLLSQRAKKEEKKPLLIPTEYFLEYLAGCFLEHQLWRNLYSRREM